MKIRVEATIHRAVILVVEAPSRDVLEDALQGCDVTDALGDLADVECEDDEGWKFDICDEPGLVGGLDAPTVHAEIDTDGAFVVGEDE